MFNWVPMGIVLHKLAKSIIRYFASTYKLDENDYDLL